ncbi:hypothetical protein [Kushneria phyllosphaerae]|uniref:Uncharacterized protein n=1 Tax=Kushneria phyllosphaerae TaxID=2100822 RepID=A0A2R8CHK6_9GAMM|nr:hypothetical protein [Kushneria phyllosphaerae]SPJ32353.1 hypothetical protein KSP9073_00353 [Kushneria phyllosphaerae]
MTSTDVHRCTPDLLADRCLPLIGCGLWLDRELNVSRLERYLSALQPHHLDIVLDVALPETCARLGAVMMLCSAHGVAPWLYVICDDDAPEADLARLAHWLEEAGVSPAGMLVTPRAYLNSHQPEGPWPEGADPEMVRTLARRYWPGIPLGGGFPTYFTELNRCRPDPEGIDFITHALSPIVHAADDVSVMETLESLPHIFKSARALAPNCPYRVTTTAIGAWTNPYGKQLTSSDGHERVTLGDRDPRQRGLFGAAWQAGVVARAAQGGVEALTLSSLGPPFDIAGSVPYPLFHVLRGLIRGSGRPLLICPDMPSEVAAVGWQSAEGTCDELWLANLSTEPVTLALQGVDVRAAALLDTHAPLEDVQWMDRLQPVSSPIMLPAFGVLRLLLE